MVAEPVRSIISSPATIRGDLGREQEITLKLAWGPSNPPREILRGFFLFLLVLIFLIILFFLLVSFSFSLFFFLVVL